MLLPVFLVIRQFMGVVRFVEIFSKMCWYRPGLSAIKLLKEEIFWTKGGSIMGDYMGVVHLFMVMKQAVVPGQKRVINRT